MWLQVFPLDGSIPFIYETTGTANDYGYFFPETTDPWRFETPGEYVVDYAVIYTDPLGRLWE